MKKKIYAVAILGMMCIMAIAGCGKKEEKSHVMTDAELEEFLGRKVDYSDNGPVVSDDYVITVTNSKGKGVEGVAIQASKGNVYVTAATDASGVARITPTEDSYEIELMYVPEGYTNNNRIYSVSKSSPRLTITLD